MAPFEVKIGGVIGAKIDISSLVAVISVGAGNRFGHPCAGVLERLRGVPGYRTDRHGAVEIISDGVQVWVETGR